MIVKRIFIWIYLVFNIPLVFSQPNPTITVAVATNFETTLTELKSLFEAKHKINILKVSGSSGKLLTQINHGAPFDIFLSGDQEHIIALEKKTLAKPINHIMYAIGELVLYAKNRDIKDQGLTKAMIPAIQHIAIANPISAPYGRAAMEVLQYQDFFNALNKKIIMGENIGQVATFLMTGNVEVGFIAHSQYIDMLQQNINQNYINSNEIWIVPQSMYKPLYQYATLIETSNLKKEAKIFLDFLISKDAKKIIMEHGYHVE